MHYKVEETMRQARQWPSRYFWMGGIGLVLLVAAPIVWWPKGQPKPDPKTEEALAQLRADKEANLPPPPVEPTAAPIPHRKAIQVK